MNELNLKPRNYQQAIFETCKEKNCLVILPTGTGKTLIALMLAIERFKKFPLEKVLILAPTRPLAEQHLNSFKKNLPEDWAQMDLFTGKTEAEKRKKIWQTAEFIFSTPQCVSNDISHKLYNLQEVSLLIEDECHRCIKNYSYNFIAQKYKEQSRHAHILGLTASPGSDKETIAKVCSNLGIEAVEIRTRESEDVKPYLQELEFEKINVDFPIEFEEIRILLKEICNEKIQELKNRKVLFTFATKTTLLETQRKIMRSITQGNRNGNLLMSASACAVAIKLQHALELLETQTLASFISYLKELFKQANEGKSKGVQRLVSDKRFLKAYTLAATMTFEHPKLEKLIEIIKEQIAKNSNSKIIVFTQYRETVNKIIENLKKISNVRASSFVGQSKKIHGTGQNIKTTGLNQKEQREIINKFSNGEINVLVATSIAEEGLDIPEVNEVIFYEPIPSAIRTIQRRGRTARLIPGALKILVTKDTRDQSFHYASISREKKMHKAIDQIKNEMENKNQVEEIEDKQERLF
jgi:Fanconi anemia group M protein